MRIEIESVLEVILVCLSVLRHMKVDYVSINFVLVIILTIFGQSNSQQSFHRRKQLKLFFRKQSDDGFILIMIIPIFMNTGDLLFPYYYNGTFTGLMAFGIYIHFGMRISLISSALLLSPLMLFLNFKSTGIIIAFVGIICVSIFISLVRTTPNSFSFAEAGLLSQLTSLMLIKYLERIYHMYFHGSSNKHHGGAISTFVLITIVSSILGTILLLTFLYFKAYWGYSENDMIITSICFYVCSTFVIFFFFYPSCLYMMGSNPLIFIWRTITKDAFRQLVVGYWFILVLISFAVVYWFSYGNTNIPKTIVRKIFHGLAFLIFMPLYKDIDFFAMVTVIVFDIFVKLELIRINNIFPFSKLLSQVLEPFREEQDSGPLILTHIYLLAGLSLPLWMTAGENNFHAKFNGDAFYFLSAYSGVLSLCVGDTFASLFGKMYGKTKWPNRKKSYIGTLACFVSMLVFSVLLLLIFHFKLSLNLVLRLIFLTFCVSLLESVSRQVDNLILPFYTFLLCRVLAKQ